MTRELTARTESGHRLVALAEEHAADFATRAAQHDADGSYPFENIEALRASGYVAAPVPEEYGGLGVESVHDLLVASSRLARGDAATAIGLNMHLIGAILLRREWRVALNREDGARAAGLAKGLRRLGEARPVVAALVSEPNQDLTRPATFARRTGDGGWSISGTKIFGTMSPAASHFAVAVTFVRDDGEERYGFVTLPRDTPGLTINDDWDALGMRASGSGSVTLDDVRVPAGAIRDMHVAGRFSTGLFERYLNSGPMHASAAMGIAEAAQAHIVDLLRGRKRRDGGTMAEHIPAQHVVAENYVDLAAMRAALGRAGDLIDEYYAAHPTGVTTFQEAAEVYAEVQAAKAFICTTAPRVVDRALTLSGGAGFMSKSPLSRYYRDVRAGGFMHPLSTPAAIDFLGQYALGLQPVNR